MQYNERGLLEEASGLFGYVITNAEALPKERQARFRAFYCGLCRRLREKYGLMGSMTLSFDMTFLAVLLNALYEPGETPGRERCLIHPAKRHDYIDTAALDYVADMNVALAFHKFRDDWLDDRRLTAAAQARLFDSAYKSVQARWPGKCAAIAAWIDEIHRIEAADLQQIDPPVNATGRALGELFVWREDDLWAETLRQIGDGMGRFIYLMDAYEDLPADVRRGRYNPLKAYSAREDYETLCHDALTMAVADATQAFELLPIVQDADILRNILYSGVWTKYVMIRKKRENREKEKNHAGPL